MFSHIQQQLYEIQQEEDSRPLINYDLSLIPKFKRASLPSLADIQIVKPVESTSADYEDSDIHQTPSFDNNINSGINAKPFNTSIMMMERKRNQKRQDDLTLATNEKIDESNRAFSFPSPTRRSLVLLPLKRQIDDEKEEGFRRNVNENQVNE